MVMPWELSILDGAHALLLRAKLAIIGDTTIAGNLDVSGEIIGGAIPIENLSNVDKQSFDSLIDNGDFKLWGSGGSSAPDGWSVASATILKETSIKAIGSYSAKVTGQNPGYLRYNLAEYNRYKGKTVTLSALVYATTASAGRIYITDGISATYSDYHTGGSGWELLTVSKLIDSSATSLGIRLEVESTNIVYVDGFILVEGLICPAYSPKPLTSPHTYSEMYIYNNSNATVIETANTPIALRQINGGLQKGFIFDAGSTGAITAYVDQGGGAEATCVGHGLSNGDIITIRGTTNYNGIGIVSNTATDTFQFGKAYVADDGASDWDQGASLTAQAGADGVYTSTWQMTTAPAGACELCFKVNINETPQDKSTACRDMAINDKDNNSSTCLMAIVEGDIIWLSVESDATSDVVNSMGNMNLERM